MKRYKQFNKLVVNDFYTDVWNHPAHNHNHFEIIFIAKGTGVHYLNHKAIPYKTGHLYLLGPEDEHEFKVHEKTRFIYFKFTKFYLDTDDVDNPALWNKDVDILLNSEQRNKGNLIKHPEDENLIQNLLYLIVSEYNRNVILSRKIIFQFFKALVVILKRNLVEFESKRVRDNMGSKIEKILEYIELNIYDPKMLTHKKIAEYFNLSPNYVGIYFKEKMETSLKKYTQEYRYALLKQRLENGQSNNKQLAYDFGFVDESHLYKFIKKVSGKKIRDLKYN
ncbi:AraC family transcriptional regulator [Euzebyella marina]|uniref:AraC family transcriptional regulator n=1 Tax=Euzebyella marina TaxID=1761453 RepID=A0A3G2L280_9FLAO|nr:AraC family transcriptional regulator [Euzebyella marina]AYN66359.1 AraC family transcriptional regulator [Euzebyella marina]